MAFFDFREEASHLSVSAVTGIDHATRQLQ